MANDLMLPARWTGQETGGAGDPGMTRTCDLRFRKPSLYPAELRDRRARWRGRLGVKYQSEAVIASLQGRDARDFSACASPWESSKIPGRNTIAIRSRGSRSVREENRIARAMSTISTTAGDHCPLRHITAASNAARIRQRNIIRTPRCVCRYGMAITPPGDTDAIVPA